MVKKLHMKENNKVRKPMRKVNRSRRNIKESVGGFEKYINLYDVLNAMDWNLVSNTTYFNDFDEAFIEYINGKTIIVDCALGNDNIYIYEWDCKPEDLEYVFEEGLGLNIKSKGIRVFSDTVTVETDDDEIDLDVTVSCGLNAIQALEFILKNFYH